MARNAEKAQSMLHRFQASQAADMGLVDMGKTRRPRAVNSVDSTPVAERWRGHVLRDISRKVTKIQDLALSDHQIRDLNDDINKLMREKWNWERRIRDLGGPNYMRGPGGSGSVVDDMGREVPGAGRGYRYFGRARDLPGVKEMFEAAAVKAQEEKEGAKGGGSGNDMRSRIVDADYYGWNRDEEDGTLLAYEAQREREMRAQMLKEAEGEEDDPDWQPLPGDCGDGVRWLLPTQAEVQQEILERKRRRLLDQLS